MSDATMHPGGGEGKARSTPYPATRAKEAFFAIKFQTHALRRGVCNDFGTDAFALLSLVVTTEDRCRFSKAPRFWWENLTDVLGIRRHRLSTILKALNDAGWLHYIPGGKGKMSVLWVAVPGGDSTINAAPLGGDELEVSSPDAVTESTPEADRMCHRKRTASVTQSGPDPSSEASLILIPTPIPLPPSPKEEADEQEDAELEALEVSLTAHQIVVTEWNVCAPVRCSRLTPSRRKILAARLKDAWWREKWRDGLARVPTARFLWGENDRKWKADFDWFIKPDSLARILEGKYDHAAAIATSRSGGPVVGPGDRHDTSRPLSAEDFAR
jgi:hypothetical protein